MSKKSFMQAALTRGESDPSPKEFTGVPQISPFADWDYYYMRAPLIWSDESDDRALGSVHVTVGFVCDLASIPRLFWVLLPTTARYTAPAIIHDYLYWFQPASHDRGRADQVFDLGMRELGVSAWKRCVIYAAVRLGGGWSWNKNKAARDTGEKRVLRKFPTELKTTWDEWKCDPSVFM